MSANQAAKLAHEFILLINALLFLVDEYREKVHTCYPIGKAVSKTVKRWLIK